MAIVKRHVKAIIQFRRATEREWIDRNPILRAGEPALSTDVDRVKVGDGIRHWLELKYIDNETEQSIYFVNDIGEAVGKEDCVFIDKSNRRAYIWQDGGFVEVEAEKTKLYDEIGYNIDGGMTQRSVTVAIEESADPIPTIDLLNILV